MLNQIYRIPSSQYFILLAVPLVSACGQPPGTELPSAEPQSERPASTATGKISSAVQLIPTSTSEADPRGQLGSSVWGAVFEDSTETWDQFESDQS